ncbi:ATP-binding protein [Trichloromonas sp.]|uniref:ATP-binding protein n=1 Tax=Trichloromonas sp. TaxID=3069249 RepID=UPI003D81B480
MNYLKGFGMRTGIKHRLFIALLAATGLVAVGMLLIMQWSIDRGFLQYVNTLEQERLERLAIELEQAYAEQLSWNFLHNDPINLFRLMIRTLPERQFSPEQIERFERRMKRRHEEGGIGAGREPKNANPDLFERRVVLQDSRRQVIFAPAKIPPSATFRPLLHQRQTVGYLGLVPRKDLADANQLRFVRQQKWAMLLIAGLMLVVSALLALPLASRMVRPIRSLAQATRRLAAGDFSTRVPAARSDELGQLALDFNSLALALEKNEQARRQWVADISHELRTPLSVLRGEIEALQDGVRQPTPQAIGSLHSEALRLGRLVDDLYQLALSDVGALTYRKTELQLSDLLDQAIEPLKADFSRKEIALHFELPRDAGVPLFADAERLQQLFGNLLENSLKYTDAGGQLEIRLENADGAAVIHFSDSAPGVPETELDKLFDRLYRVESSRNRHTGGAGLGLSICRNIVEAHEGTISARPSPLGGLWISIRLPFTRTTS